MGINSLTIEIEDFGNSAMVDDSAGEVVRILKETIKSIEKHGLENLNGTTLRDFNGNHVCEITVDVDDEDDFDDEDVDDEDDCDDDDLIGDEDTDEPVVE